MTYVSLHYIFNLKKIEWEPNSPLPNASPGYYPDTIGEPIGSYSYFTSPALPDQDNDNEKHDDSGETPFVQDVRLYND